MAYSPRIYVACLASYNSGILHGAWIEAATDPWTIWHGINAMLAKSPVAGAEEFAIHDYEDFGSVRIAEHAGIEQVASLAAFLVEHGAVGVELLAYYGGDIDEAQEAISDRYLGCFASLADHMQEHMEDVIAIPPALQGYVDWEAMARDAELSGDLFTLETGFEQVHVFATY